MTNFQWQLIQAIDAYGVAMKDRRPEAGASRSRILRLLDRHFGKPWWRKCWEAVFGEPREE